MARRKRNDDPYKSKVSHGLDERRPKRRRGNMDEVFSTPDSSTSKRRSVSVWDNASENLAALYRPPFELMFSGPLQEANKVARLQDKWVLVNLQSKIEFNSHVLNRDTWANKDVADAVKKNFIFWQFDDDTGEGRKLCTYYKLDANDIPAVMVIDPITGQKVSSYNGLMAQPISLLKNLTIFMDCSPIDFLANQSQFQRDQIIKQDQLSQWHNQDERSRNARSPFEPLNSFGLDLGHALAASIMEGSDGDMKEPSYPPLTEEPKVEQNLVCRVCIRFPDGSRIQRNFLHSDSIQLLWSLCCSKLEEAKRRPFRLAHAIPGGSKSLEYESGLNFHESGLANSLISLLWT